MRILLMHQTVATHDAIGNDIEIMFGLIREMGFECLVYAQNQLNKNVSYISKEDLSEYVQDRNTVVMYHHSVYWEEGEQILKSVKGQIVFRYHNITPEHFFENYNDFHYSQCKVGREQTKRLIKDYPDALWLVDSNYNALDLEGVEKSKITVCAPFHKIEQWSQCVLSDEIIQKLMNGKRINLLFVGRVAPNKGHLFLLEILRVFCLNYRNDIKLYIIGKKDDGLPGYNDLIDEKIIRYGLEDCVEFVGEINDSILASYYIGADLFVSASEHEGFCVPVIEAQYFGLPVVALSECAVPETGGDGIVLLDKNARKFAAAIKLLAEKKEWYSELRERGIRNYEERFSFNELKKIFVQYIQNL